MNRDVNVKMQAVKRCVHDFEDLHTNKTDTQSECAFCIYWKAYCDNHTVRYANPPPGHCNVNLCGHNTPVVVYVAYQTQILKKLKEYFILNISQSSCQ